jgi:hypothetical protein
LATISFGKTTTKILTTLTLITTMHHPHDHHTTTTTTTANTTTNITTATTTTTVATTAIPTTTAITTREHNPNERPNRVQNAVVEAFGTINCDVSGSCLVFIVLLSFRLLQHHGRAVGQAPEKLKLFHRA